MEGNCKNAQPVFGKRDGFPCIYYNDTYGAAITGLVDPLNLRKPLTITLKSIGGKYNIYEPNVRTGEDPIDLEALITMSDLEPF